MDTFDLDRSIILYIISIYHNIKKIKIIHISNEPKYINGLNTYQQGKIPTALFEKENIFWPPKDNIVF